ncbi:MAG: copper amine oxidase N-terminal domain-containing protein [Solirubrobacterales bacterium]
MESSTGIEKPKEQVQQPPIRVLVDEKEIHFFEQIPYFREEVLYLPLRAIASALGIKIAWNYLTSTATMVIGDRKVRVKIGATEATVNGKHVPLESKTVVKAKRMMVPLSFFRDVMGLEHAEWMVLTRTVVLTYKGEYHNTYKYKKYTLPKQPTLFSVEFPFHDESGVEFDAYLSLNDMVDEQYYELFMILDSKFGADVAKDVLAYVRMKKEELDELHSELFKTDTPHTIYVDSPAHDHRIYVSVQR